MKKLAILSVLGLSTQASACIFGDDLVEAARYKGMLYSQAETIDLTWLPSEQELKELQNGMRDEGTFEEIVAYTDDDRFYVHNVIDAYHQKHYRMYIYSRGDNINGFYTSQETGEVVATIGDASISCDIDFENYDALNWFYSN